MRPFNSNRGRRRGTVTVIVVAFLALFFVLALTFAFYSIAEADQAKVYRDGADLSGPSVLGGAPDPDPIFNQLLGNLIYDVPDGLPGAFNGLRGQSLARLMYDFNPADLTGSTQAFNGVGRVDPNVVHKDIQGVMAAYTPTNRINWTLMPSQPALIDPDNNWARDPVTLMPAINPATYRHYARNANYTYPDLNNLYLGAIDPKSGSVLAMSFHRRDLLTDSSTNAENLPDNPVSGPVAVPAFNPADTNPWTNATGRMLMLRPRPVDNRDPSNPAQSYFLYPKKNIDPVTKQWDGTYGDVINLVGKAAGAYYDSVWIDIDSSVETWNGKKYKALVALLVLDLDNRVNVNTAGNFYVLPDSDQPPSAARSQILPQYGHGSGQGFGPWEQNLARVMPSYTNPADPRWIHNDAAQLSLPRLVWNQNGTAPQVANPPFAVHNRYGWDGGFSYPNRRFRVFPNENTFLNQPSPGNGAHFYSMVDFEGRGPTGATKYGANNQGHETTLVFGPPASGTPGQANDPPRPSSSNRYQNGMYVTAQNGQPLLDERSNHPLLYNPFWVKPVKRTSDPYPDRAFGVEELRYLASKYNFDPAEKFTGSDLALLAKNTLANPKFDMNQLNPRFAVTPLSTDLFLPGASPWLSAPPGTYMLTSPNLYPVGTPQPFSPSDSTQPGPQGNADHDSGYRAKLASLLGPVDLNRKLTDYRSVSTQPLGPDNMGNAARAVQDRQRLAQDIFDRLRFVTTGETGNITAGPGTPNYDALRWLAQLSVNIVDYIDTDDLMTPFNWNPSAGTVQDGWVYGVERPRLVMNETYLRYENMRGDPGAPVGGMKMNKKASLPSQAQPAYSLRAWLELHNPITPANPAEQNLDPNGDDGTHGGYRALLEEKVNTGGGPPTPQSAYRILVYRIPVGGAAQDPMGMRKANNVLGVPNLATPQPAGWPKVVDFSDSTKVKSAPQGKTVEPNIGPQLSGKSFYVLGPEDDKPAGGGNDAKLPDQSVQANMTHSGLSFQIDAADVDGNNRPTWVPAFVLQRLANPYQTAGSGDPSQPPTDPRNPYVTVDYLEPDTTGKSVYDRVEFRIDGMRGPDPGSDMKTQPDLNTTYAWGRRQPYDGRIDYNDTPPPGNNKYIQGNGGAAMGQIGGQTFGKHNAKTGNWPAPAPAGNYASTWESPGSQTNDTLQVPFLPLPHLDRNLLSSAELLQVAAVKPSELTKTYYMAQADMTDPTKRRTGYTANWLDSPDSALTGGNKSTFLFRALDFLKTGSWTEGIPLGGRVPGKVNLNTVFANLNGPTAAEHLLAVTDPNGANRFQQTDVDGAWGAFVGATGRQQTPGKVTPSQDKPFLGSATAVTTAGMGGGTNSQDRTFLRAGALWKNGSNDESFQPNVQMGAAQKYELLGKSLNHLTTRSNTFAVYATIGYFEVLNDGPYDAANRPILGKELGTDDGTVTRHKFFAVIDRTNLTVEPAGGGKAPNQGQPPVYLAYQPSVPLPSGPSYQIFPDPDLPTLGANSPVQVRVPAVSQSPANTPPNQAPTSISGYYDGTQWTILDNPALPSIKTYAWLGLGSTQELVQLKLMPGSFDPNTGTATVLMYGTKPAGPPNQYQFYYAHHRGEPLRLAAPDPLQAGSTPGNPGPQSGFQYRASRYSPVVRYVEQMR